MNSLARLRIVVTRAADQAEALAAPLRELGAHVVVLPTIGIAPPANPEALRQAARELDRFDWVVFTSTNSVRALAAHLPQKPRSGLLVAAVGSATQEAAKQAGFAPATIGESYVAESLVEAIGNEDIKGKRILIPKAAVTRDVIASKLQERGAEVTVVEAYRNVCPSGTETVARRMFVAPLPDWVLFASPSAFHNLLAIVGRDILARIRIASIGPVTSSAILREDCRVDVEAKPQTIVGLVEALVRFVSR